MLTEITQDQIHSTSIKLRINIFRDFQFSEQKRKFNSNSQIIASYATRDKFTQAITSTSNSNGT